MHFFFFQVKASDQPIFGVLHMFNKQQCIEVSPPNATVRNQSSYTVHGFLQARYWSGQPSPGDIPKPGIKLRSPTLQVDSLPAEPPGKPSVQGFPQQMQQLEIKAPSFCLIYLMPKLYLHGFSCHTLASALSDVLHTSNPTVDSSFPKYITRFPIFYFTLTELSQIFHLHVYG